MMFYTGQKVARVGGLAATPGVVYPPLHKPCTVANVYSDPLDGELMIELTEYPQPETHDTRAGFRAQFFRPVVEKKTDISIFTKLLTPNPQRRELVSSVNGDDIRAR